MGIPEFHGILDGWGEQLGTYLDIMGEAAKVHQEGVAQFNDVQEKLGALITSLIAYKDKTEEQARMLHVAGGILIQVTESIANTPLPDSAVSSSLYGNVATMNQEHIALDSSTPTEQAERMLEVISEVTADAEIIGIDVANEESTYTLINGAGVSAKSMLTMLHKII